VGAQICPKPRRVGIVADQAAILCVNRVDRADGFGRFGEFIQQRNDRLFVRNGHIQPVDLSAADAFQQSGQLVRVGRVNREQGIAAFQPGSRQCGVVQFGRKAVGEGEAGQAEG
jgi:hypothetical protein